MFSGLSWNWNSNGKLTEVKLQDEDTCVAFGITDILENIYKLRFGKEIRLSVQELINFAEPNTKEALVYVLRNGIVSERDYPFVSGEPNLLAPKPKDESPRLKLHGLGVLEPDPELLDMKVYNDVMKTMVLTHLWKTPLIGVALVRDDDLNDLRGERGWEIYQSNCLEDLSGHEYHAIQIVGLGNDKGKDFFITRNTYGVEWGVDGYGRIACQQILGAYFPLIEKKEEHIEESVTTTDPEELKTESRDIIQLFATPEEIQNGKLVSLPADENYEVGKPSAVLNIRNLAKDVVNDDFYFIFGSLFGNVDLAKSSLGVKLMQEERMSGQATVTFPTVDLAQRALNLANGFVFKGKPMVIQFGRRRVTLQFRKKANRILQSSAF